MKTFCAVLTCAVLSHLMMPIGVRAEDAVLVSTWEYRDTGGTNGSVRTSMLKLYSNGRIDSPDSRNTWERKADTLILRWPNPKAPGGAWVATCKMAADGKSFKGRNQARTLAEGRLVDDAVAPAVGTTNTVPKNPKPADPARNLSATEFQRFAEFAAMESFQNEIYFDRTALWRANQLLQMKLTDPALRKAAREYLTIALKSWLAVKILDTTDWRPPATQKADGPARASQIVLRELLQQSGLPEANQNTILAATESDEAFQKDVAENLRKTFEKVKDLEKARKLAWESRLEHARLWDRVLTAVKPAGGPERQKFPLRIGVGHGFWIRNVSGTPLTNLTCVVRTNSSAELSADVALHVISLERLEPDESVAIPGRIFSKLWDEKTRRFQTGSNVLRCSVWSGEVHFDDVHFDLKDLPARAPDYAAAPEGWCKWGCFPTSDFRGQYEVTAPWPIPTLTARQDSLSMSTWVGTDAASKKEFQVLISRALGVNLNAVKLTIGASEEGQSAIFEGKLHGNQFKLERVIDGPIQPGFPTHLSGTLAGDEMELNYGTDQKLKLRRVPRLDRAAAEKFIVGSVWVDDEKKKTLTVIERDVDRFKARYQIGDTIDRELNGEITGKYISWRARDVKAALGGTGGDNNGAFRGEDGPKIDFAWRGSNGASGTFTLRLRQKK